MFWKKKKQSVVLAERSRAPSDPHAGNDRNSWSFKKEEESDCESIDEVPSSEYGIDNPERNRIYQKDPKLWTVADVGLWLGFLNLEEYRINFIQNAVSGSDLLDIQDNDLDHLQVKRLGHRKLITRKIQALKAGKRMEGCSIDDLVSERSENSKSSKHSVTSSEDGELAFENDLTIKCFFRDQVRVLDGWKAVCGSNIQALKNRLKEEFAEDFIVKYKDADGDLVTIGTDKELKRAVGKDSVMRLHLEPRQIFSEAEVNSLNLQLDALIIFEKNGIMKFLNKAALDLFLFQESPLDQNLRLLLGKSDGKNKRIVNHLNAGEIELLGTKSVAICCKRSDGSKFEARFILGERKINQQSYFTAKIVEVQQSSNQWVSLDWIRDPAVVIDENGIVQFFNRGAEILTGYTKEKIIGQNVNILMPEPYKSQHDGYLASFNKTGEGEIMNTGFRDVPLQIKSGESVAVSLRLSEQESGEKKYFIGLLVKKEETAH